MNFANHQRAKGVILSAIVLFFSTVATMCSYSQRTITAKVLDSDTKTPIPSARILLVGTSTTTETNDRGYFQLKTDTSSILIIEKEGYEVARLNVEQDFFHVHLKKE